MALLLTLKRFKEGNVWYEAGEVFDFDLSQKDLSLLIHRGLAVPVNSDFVKPANAGESSPPPIGGESESSPEGDKTGDEIKTDADPDNKGEVTPDPADHDPIEDTDDYKGLMAMTRSELDEQATSIGVVDADKLSNKDAVAKAILAKLAE